jgi:predicted nuclease of predicted toxin-antitoxin system
VRFLADESCDHAVVRALRAAGHDVVLVSDVAPQSDDDVLMAVAKLADRILLTEDRDFGTLVYARGLSTAGVLYIRLRAPERPFIGPRIVAEVQRLGERLVGAFVVVGTTGVRIGRPPPS